MPKRTSDKDNLAFHLDLLKQIPYHRKITARELHQQMLALGYTKSLRAVQRALAKLTEEYDIDCDNRTVPYGYRRLGKPPVTQSLTSTQAAFIKISTERLKKSVPANLISAMKPLVEQADFVLKHGNRQSRENIWLRHLQMSKAHPDISESLLNDLSQQIYQQKQVELHSSILFKRLTVSPLGLFDTAFSVYLIAYLDGEIKAYDLRYINEIRPLELAVEYPKGFDLNQYQVSATQFDTPVITLSSSHQPEENRTMSSQNFMGLFPFALPKGEYDSSHFQSKEANCLYHFSSEEEPSRIHIIAKGSFGKNVMESIALPESEMLSVEFLEEQQVSLYESEKLDFLFVISDDFNWLQVQNYQNVDVQMIIGSRPYRGLIKPHSCFVYSQSIEQYQIMIQSILDAFFIPGLISIDGHDFKKLVEKGGTGVVASSFRGGNADSHRAKKAAEAVLAELKATSTNLRQIEGCFVCITASDDIELQEVDVIMSTFMETVNPEAIVLFGTGYYEHFEGIQVNVIAVV